MVFTSTHALFDEAMFPHCKTQLKKHKTWIQQDITPSNPIRLLPDMPDDDDPLLELCFKAPAPAVECPETLEHPEAPPPMPQIPQCTPRQPPQAPPATPSMKEEFHLDQIMSMMRGDILSSSIKMWRNSLAGRKLSTNNLQYQLFPNLVFWDCWMRYQM